VPLNSRTYKLINRSLGKALNQYQMIRDGDRIAVGFSGGKDSWALLWLLDTLQRRAPVQFKLFPIFIDPGFQGGPADAIAEHGHAMGFDIRIEQTDHGLVAHSDRNRENPCFLCSRLRRKRLFDIARELGCSKLALAHNKDDIIETLFLNMCYAGEISTMMPAQPFFDGRLTLIRPLAYTDEDTLIRFATQMQWPVEQNPCPSAGRSKRAEVKAMLQRLYARNKKIKGNIFRAMRRVKPAYLLR
jgi:tRNA 2-thiocytidine biosynthesis protein TtcA